MNLWQQIISVRVPFNQNRISRGGKVAFVKFKNFDDSREAYRLANKTTIRGKQMEVRPLMHSEGKN